MAQRLPALATDAKRRIARQARENADEQISHHVILVIRRHLLRRVQPIHVQWPAQRRAHPSKTNTVRYPAIRLLRLRNATRQPHDAHPLRMCGSTDVSRPVHTGRGSRCHVPRSHSHFWTGQIHAIRDPPRHTIAVSATVCARSNNPTIDANPNPRRFKRRPRARRARRAGVERRA